MALKHITTISIKHDNPSSDDAIDVKPENDLTNVFVPGRGLESERIPTHFRTIADQARILVEFYRTSISSAEEMSAIQEDQLHAIPEQALMISFRNRDYQKPE